MKKFNKKIVITLMSSHFNQLSKVIITNLSLPERFLSAPLVICALNSLLGFRICGFFFEFVKKVPLYHQLLYY